MCGIVGAISKRNVVPILLDGLHRLEYRGYDSAGVAVIVANELQRLRATGKVKSLSDKINNAAIFGTIGIAHTRWATHGLPSETNAHPHMYGDRIAVVHNGIVENYISLKTLLPDYQFSSETDTEVLTALLYSYLLETKDMLQTLQKLMQHVTGSFALCVIDKENPDTLWVAKVGSPLVIGQGIEEYFVASDYLALHKVSQEFIVLDDYEIASVSLTGVNVFDMFANKVAKQFVYKNYSYELAEKGDYRHFMQKEIFEQPNAISSVLSARITKNKVLEQSFGYQAQHVFKATKHIVIVACGTSYYAGLVAKHWLEEIAQIHCDIEIASEFRYRKKMILANTLVIAMSQSGETADTLSAIQEVKKTHLKDIVGVLAICNVPDSSLVRLADLVFLTNAGPEIGVASTKAFTAQLTSLLMLTTILARKRGLAADFEFEIVRQISQLPIIMHEFLALDLAIKTASTLLRNVSTTLFLGRGIMYPIALEGALKLKEISYIHAQAFPAGELKHGPLALVDNSLPVIILAPDNDLFEKTMANVSEVKTRGGKVILITDVDLNVENSLEGIYIIKVPKVPALLAPIAYVVPLQLLAYYVAVLKGTDVDQPRNLAKSVTVE